MAANDADPTWLLLLLIGILLIAGWIIWYFFGTELLEFMRYVRMVELAPVALFDSQARACLAWLNQAQVGRSFPSDSAVAYAANCFGVSALRSMTVNEALDYYTLTTTSLGVVSRLAMNYVRWFFVAFCAYAGYRAIFVSKRNAFKTRHNLESFIKAQAKMWPVIEPIVNFNPTKSSARIPGTPMPSRMPTFAEAMSPEEWLSFHRIPITGGIPDKERVRRALHAQLGPRWAGIKELPPYIQGLIAAFALKGVQKRDESDEFLGKLSVCWSVEKGFKPSPELAAEIKKILNDPEIGGKAVEVAAKHAYRTTALLGLLRWARFMGGVLAAAQFLWLRGVDRNLWYALNNQGRRSFHSEGAGAMAHYMAEEAAQKALPIPRLETAIISINQYLAANQPVIPPHEETNKVKA